MLEPAQLILEDGSTFKGISIGNNGIAFGEVVFNTAISGYQEILTDPSYAKQIITLTYPHIGNVGVNPDDEESDGIFAAGLIIRDLPLALSNWRSTDSLESYLKSRNVVAIAELDTRALTQLLREKGALRGALVCDSSASTNDIINQLQDLPSLAGQDLAKIVSTQQPYEWDAPLWSELDELSKPAIKQDCHVVVLDFGVKKSILRHLRTQGARVTVLPATASFEEILACQPDGVLLSNGPGDPEPCDYAINCAKALIDKGIPTFGICLGFQILSLAVGAKTQKMKFGHHGGNHPVKDHQSGRVMITSQNHGFCVDIETLPDTVAVTHTSLFDGTLQGWRHLQKPVMGFQGHPEAGPGPVDGYSLFSAFIKSCTAETNPDLTKMSV